MMRSSNLFGIIMKLNRKIIFSMIASLFVQTAIADTSRESIKTDVVVVKGILPDRL